MKVRTTMRPDEEIEVDEHEAGELRSQGLLIEDDKPPRRDVAKDKEN
jgi:hypothetical protein